MQPENRIKIIETPRDGMQGLSTIIPTAKKIEYINLLLKCGFDTVEVGSFVSPKAIPQMADTAEVLKNLDYLDTQSKIAVLVGNLKGGRMAVEFEQVDEIFYPFSTSPTFLKKNLNTSISEAEKTIDGLQELCVHSGKELVAFLSLAFGDPYGDEWNVDLVYKWVEQLVAKGIKKIPFADTIGDIAPEVIYEVCHQIIGDFPGIEFGLHAHALPGQGKDKIEAAYRCGIRRFDTVIGGLGGCPMTDKELVGNLALETLISWCVQQNIPLHLNKNYLKKAEKFIL